MKIGKLCFPMLITCPSAVDFTRCAFNIDKVLPIKVVEFIPGTLTGPLFKQRWNSLDGLICNLSLLVNLWTLRINCYSD